MRFRITDEATGKPVQRLAPGAWMDMGENIRDREGAEQKSCKDKIALYLKGVVGIRPMIDLNSYYVVVMNRDASVSILDPTVSMVGRTSTLAQVKLPAPGHGLGAQQRRPPALRRDADRGQGRGVIETDTFKLGGVVPRRTVADAHRDAARRPLSLDRQRHARRGRAASPCSTPTR